MDLLEDRPGIITFKASGKKASSFFTGEAGSHRFQRVPPTESKGRVHTSTITVAALPEATTSRVVIKDRDLLWSFCRGSGAGGQHRNVTDSAAIVKHRPSGVTVRCESERKQDANKRKALELLRIKLCKYEEEQRSRKRSEDRRKQVGEGYRNGKRRTISVPRNQVVDHETGRQWTYKKYVRGDWE